MLKKCIAPIISLLVVSAIWSQAQAPTIRNPYNPPPFQRFAAPVSGPTRFLFGEHGVSLLRGSGSPVAIAVLKALGEPIPKSSDYPPAIAPEGLFSQPAPILQPQADAEQSPLIVQQPQAVTVTGCGPDGTVFNLEPVANAAPQMATSVDFAYNGVTAGADLVVAASDDFRNDMGPRTFYYVHRGTTGCSPAFEGALPALVGLSGETDSTIGNGAVAADPARGAFFIADQHLGSNSSGGTTAIGLFRTTNANLLNTGTCPAGTQNSSQAATCWPTRILVNPLPQPGIQFQQEYPSLAVDRRGSGTGASDVYVTGTEFDMGAGTSRTWLVACKNNLSVCSSPVFISGSDASTALSNVQVRPDGVITTTYVDFANPGYDLKFASCKPVGAPFTPACSPPVLVHGETRPIIVLTAEPFIALTFPRHSHRVDAGVTQTFVVWHRCKVIASGLCPDSDVAMKFSTNGGSTWSALTNVDATNDDQFLPSITTDASRQTINIAYLNNHVDPVFQHRAIVDLVQIPPGTTTHSAPVALTSTPDALIVGGPFVIINEFLSLSLSAKGTGAAGASRLYGTYTYDLRFGTYNGISDPQPDNFLDRATY